MALRLALCASIAMMALASPATSKPKDNKHHFDWPTINSVIAFGDSYTYVQGTLGRQNYSFIGDNFDLSFTPEELFSNRIVQNLTGTAEGGPNWVQFLTKCGVENGLHDPRKCGKQLWDFAFAGADVIDDNNFTPLHHNFTVSFQRQIEQFVSYGNPALESIHLNKKNALVTAWIGINDINDLSSIRGRNSTFTPLFEQDQDYTFEAVEKVYGLGYRNFLFMNLPPLDRGPGISHVNASMVAEYNSIHAAHADAFQAKHRDTTVLQFDVNSVLNVVLDHYQDYGFKNITDYCPGYNQPDILTNPEKYGCTELNSYLWYNSGHLTSHTHKIFAKALSTWLTKQ
jgi:phospholipase/lecithinase/hemolysin